MAIEERGTGTQSDPFLFKNYEEFKYYMDNYDAQHDRYNYFKFDRANATTEDIESFDFNKISELGVYNVSGFIPWIYGQIDFDGLIVKNLYKQNNSSYRSPSSGYTHYSFIEGSTYYSYGKYCCTIKNLKFFNFVLTGGDFIKGETSYSAYCYFVNCEFSGLLRKDSGHNYTYFSQNAVFINCSFNLNIKYDNNIQDSNVGDGIFASTTWLINCTVRLTGYDKVPRGSRATLTLLNVYALGTKFLGSLEIDHSYLNIYILIQVRLL